VIPIQFVLVSIFLAPFLGAGLVRLLRLGAGSARAFGYAYLALLVLVFATGGKGYYAAGLMPVIVASDGLATDNWLARGRRRLRIALVSVATGVGRAHRRRRSIVDYRCDDELCWRRAPLGRRQ